MRSLPRWNGLLGISYLLCYAKLHRALWCTASKPSRCPALNLGRRPAPDLRAFMRGCMYNAAEKLEDAVAVLTSR